MTGCKLNGRFPPIILPEEAGRRTIQALRVGGGRAHRESGWCGRGHPAGAAGGRDGARAVLAQGYACQKFFVPFREMVACLPFAPAD